DQGRTRINSVIRAVRELIIPNSDRSDVCSVSVWIIRSILAGEIPTDDYSANSRFITKRRMLTINARVDDRDSNSMAVKLCGCCVQSAGQRCRLRAHTRRAGRRFEMSKRPDWPIRREVTDFF